MNKIIIYYLIVINIISFILTGLDKLLAIKKKRRISEFTLIIISFIGGAFGEILAMLLFHHKTKHIKFLLLNPLFMLLWLLIYLYFFK